MSSNSHHKYSVNILPKCGRKSQAYFVTNHHVCISTGDKGEKSDDGGSDDGKIHHQSDVVL